MTNHTNRMVDDEQVEDAIKPWFDAARLVDRKWAEFDVTTPRGERISYRIPRSTVFDPADSVSTRTDGSSDAEM